MSTRIRFACIDHAPPIINDNLAFAQHNEREEMREVLAHRDLWEELYEDERVEIIDSGIQSAAQFFTRHRTCRMACVNEYGKWTDLGQGVPRGYPLDDEPLDEPPARPVKSITQDDVVAMLAQLEMDRRAPYWTEKPETLNGVEAWLLSLRDHLGGA